MSCKLISFVKPFETETNKSDTTIYKLQSFTVDDRICACSAHAWYVFFLFWLIKWQLGIFLNAIILWHWIFSMSFHDLELYKEKLNNIWLTSLSTAVWIIVDSGCSIFKWIPFNKFQSFASVLQYFSIPITKILYLRHCRRLLFLARDTLFQCFTLCCWQSKDVSEHSHPLALQQEARVNNNLQAISPPRPCFSNGNSGKYRVFDLPFLSSLLLAFACGRTRGNGVSTI